MSPSPYFPAPLVDRERMTDPRLIECAKALCRLDGNDPELAIVVTIQHTIQHTGHTKGAEFKIGAFSNVSLPAWDKYVPAARACILKWLEQPETLEMRGAAQQSFVRAPTRSAITTRPCANKRRRNSREVALQNTPDRTGFDGCCPA